MRLVERGLPGERVAVGIPDTADRSQAKDLQELVRMQSLFVQSQMQVLAEQMQELGKSASKAATAGIKGSRNEDTW